MPYRRRYKKSNRRRYRKRGGLASTAWRLAKKAARGVVKYYLNPEYKFSDYASTGPISNAGTVFSNINFLPLGDTAESRNGNSIKVTSHLLRFNIIRNTAATATTFRFIIFTDVSSNGAVPAVVDVLDNSSALSPLNSTNGARFHILMDRTYTLSADKPIVASQYFRKMNHHIKFIDNTASNSSLGQGPIYMLAISNETTNTPTFALQSRIRFLDN